MKTSLAMLTTLLLAGAAHAQPVEQPPAQASAIRAPRWSFDFGPALRWFGDTSGAIVSSDPLAGARLTIGRSLTQVTTRHRPLELGVFARWTTGGATGTIFQDLATQVGQHQLTAGVRLDAPLVWRTRLVAQAELGMARTALAVTAGDMTVVDDHAWGMCAAASLGGDLALLDGPRFRLALGVDLGYTVASAADLRALPGDRPAEDLSIPTTFASIGKLDTRGITYAFSIRGSF
jgi:hypothetical protein